VIRHPGPNDDKYSRGVVGLLVGSQEYPGAAALVCEAALSAGAGMVRLVTDPAAEQVVLATRPEVVITPGRVDAAVVGCGIPAGHREDITQRLKRLHLSDDGAVVVDAGALGYASEIPGSTILTPHHNELAALARALGYQTMDPREQAAQLAREWDVVVYLKGSQSAVFTPDGVAYELEEASPWLATAGTGDVLAGVMGALLAQQKKESWNHSELARVAAVAGWIHAQAAEKVSRESGGGTPGPILAAELARAVSSVVAEVAS
jgi:hydroxyethylthiazole kinase-like uncharacterized protein yjeF